MKSSLAFLALATLATSGCNSRTTGNEGNFVFSYRADDDPSNFNKPIAVGASLDMEVRSVGSGEPPVSLSAVTADPAEVLEVVSFSGHEMTVKGTADGEVLVEVTGTDQDGEELSDSVNMLVRVPEVLKLWHTCDRESNSAAYLAGTRVWMGFDMEMANEQPVIGYGYYPMTSSDAALAAISTANSNQTHIAIDTGSTAGTVTIDSDIDETSRTVIVATEAEIDGVAEPIAFVIEDIDVGDTNAFYVLPMVGENTLCQATVNKTVESDTPDICTVTDSQSQDDNLFELGWFEVTGVAEGDCLYTVTYPDGNDGDGASAQFTYPIEP